MKNRILDGKSTKGLAAFLAAFVALLFLGSRAAFAVDGSALDGFENDRIYKSLAQIFGSVVDASFDETVVGSMFRVYTDFVVSVAGVWLLYLLAVGVLNSAKDGEAFGRGWSGTWGILRTIGSFAMLTPTPSGFPAIIYVIMLAAQLGVRGGNEVWSVTIDSIADDVRPLSTPHGIDSTQMAQQIMQVQGCVALYNEMHKDREWQGPKMDIVGKGGEGTDAYVLESTKTDILPAGACGRITIDFSGLVKEQGKIEQGTLTESLKQIRKVHSDAVWAFITAGDPVVSKMAGNIVHPNTPAGDVTDAEAENLAKQVLAYDYAVMSTAKLIRDDSGDSARAKFKEDASASGWSAAGRFWMTLSKLNGRSLAAMRFRPQVEMPNYQVIADTFSADEYAGAMFGSMPPSVDDFWINDVDRQAGAAKVTKADLSAFSKYTTLEGVMNMFGSFFAQSLSSFYTPAPSDIDDMINDDVYDTYLELGSVDPISRLVDFGHTLIVTAEVAQGALIAANVGAAAAKASSDGFSNIPVVGWVGGVATGGITGGVVALVNLITEKIDPMVTVIFLAGLYFAFVIPFMVWVHFMLSVVGWIVLVLEAALAAPIWMLVHMNFKGDEFVDHRMTPGWMILLAIIIKPMLIIIGFVLSIVVFVISSSLIQSDINPMMNDITQGHSVGFPTFVIKMVLMGVAFAAVSKIAFRLMTTLPDNVISRWMGGPSVAQQEEHDTQSAVALAGGARALESVAKTRHVSGVPWKGKKSVSVSDGGSQPGKNGSRMRPAADDIPLSD